MRQPMVKVKFPQVLKQHLQAVKFLVFYDNNRRGSIGMVKLPPDAAFLIYSDS